MALKGVIFDFNGTLFWDTKLHNTAWDIFLEKKGIRLTDRGKTEKIHGRNNKDIISSLFPMHLENKEIVSLSNEKERIYQELCLKTEMQLAPGAKEFLRFLMTESIPYTIATASELGNINFYKETGKFKQLLGEKGDPFDFSPAEHLKEKMPPSIIVVGKDDTVSPVYQSELFHKNMLDHGNESFLHIYDGVGHLFTPSDRPDDQYPDPDKKIRAEAYEEIDLFLKKLGYID